MKRLHIPAVVAVSVGVALVGCPGPETCFRTQLPDGAYTSQTCENDAGCYTFTTPTGQVMFTDCPVPDACVSVRTFPDGGTGVGGDYC